MRSSLPSVSRPPRGKQVRRLPIHLAANAVCGPLPKGSGAQSGAAAEIASCLLLPPAAAGRDPLRKCRSAAIISRSRTTTGWIKGGEKSPPLPFQLGGFQRGEEIGIFPPLACFLFLSSCPCTGREKMDTDRVKDTERAAGRRKGGLFSPLPITRAGDIITCLTLLWL